MTDNNKLFETEDESRRSFMVKGALASGGIALGLSGAGSAAAQQMTALVFADDYLAGVPLQSMGQLQSDVTQSILQSGGVSNAGQYQGYVVQYDLGQTTDFAMLFVSGAQLQQGQAYTLGSDATVASAQINLLEVAVSQGGGVQTETPAEGETPQTETPQTETPE